MPSQPERNRSKRPLAKKEMGGDSDQPSYKKKFSFSPLPPPPFPANAQAQYRENEEGDATSVFPRDSINVAFVLKKTCGSPSMCACVPVLFLQIGQKEEELGIGNRTSSDRKKVHRRMLFFSFDFDRDHTHTHDNLTTTR